MMRLIILVIAIAAVWFAYTNLGKPLNVDKVIQDGQSSLKNEKSINRVINTREDIRHDNEEAMKR